MYTKEQQDKMETYVLAGKCTFSLKSERTKKNVKFFIVKPQKAKPGTDVRFVYVKQSRHWMYLGVVIIGGRHRPTYLPKKEVAGHDKNRAFYWFWMHLIARKLKRVTLYKSRACARCGRRLTEPKSIKAGFGPYCITQV